MDKAGSYSETTGGQRGAYNQEDKYEKEKRVSKGKIYHYSIPDLGIFLF